MKVAAENETETEAANKCGVETALGIAAAADWNEMKWFCGQKAKNILKIIFYKAQMHTNIFINIHTSMCGRVCAYRVALRVNVCLHVRTRICLPKQIQITAKAM